MSYCIEKLKLTENNKSRMSLIPKQMRDDISNGYYPYELNDVLPDISKGKKLVLEVNGDYGHYLEVWENGKNIKTLKADTIIKNLKKSL